MDRKYVKRYFEGFPFSNVFVALLGLGGIIIGICVCAFGKKDEVPVGAMFGIGGFVAMAAAIYQLAGLFGAKPSDEAIDEQLRSDFVNCLNSAQKKLSVADEQLAVRPMFLWSPLWADVQLVRNGTRSLDTRFKQGLDGRIRFASYRLVILLPTEDKLAMYSTRFSFSEYRVYEEKTFEYYYKEIVSIRTEENRDILITFTDGMSFSLSLPSAADAAHISQISSIPLVDFDTAVRAMRKLVQAYKQPE